MDDIVDRVRKNKNFARVNEKALKVNIQAIIAEIKKNAKVESSENEKNEKENSEKLLGKKRFTNEPNAKQDDEMDEFLFKPNISLSDLGGFDEIVS